MPPHAPHLIAILGATGNQGSSVSMSLLANPSTFRVRTLTRNTTSSAALALASAGAEVVHADAFNRQDMLAAFHGAWGVFVNTNSDDPVFMMDGGRLTEFDLGRVIVDAAADAGVKHVVLSSGPPCGEMTGGKVMMRAMEMKYKTEQYAKRLNRFNTITAINAAWYLENFLVKEVAPVFGGFPHQPDAEGILTFRVPRWGGDDVVPFLGIKDDFGDLVQGVFLDPERWNGKVVHGASDMRTFEELVGDFEAVTGKRSRYQPVLPTWEAFDIHGIAELDDVKLMFGFTQTTGGRYFSPEPSEIGTAAKLKRATAVALGRGYDQARLITAREWFGRQYAASKF
ncbi:hypothetical protein G7Y79_00005g016940 [Physcia stellaris]|nr:hypothetical protein G7Y79_00005g016940 [Physcia stellaris]